MSVVIPTHDRADLVRRAVASVLRQSFDDVEVIVVDDASSDDTLERLRLIDDPRLRVVSLSQNVGQATARNRGVEAARGHWLAFLDDDDEWLPHKLQHQLDRANETGAPVVYAPYLLGLGSRVLPHRIDLPEGRIFEQAVHGWSPPLTSTLLVRRDVLEPYDADLVGVEDYDLLLRLSHRHAIACCRDPLAIVDKTPTATRHTLQASVRIHAIDALEQRWRGRLSGPLAAAWRQTCAELRLVAWLTVGGGGPDSRLALARRTIRSGIPPRTKLAGLLRLAVGPRLAAVIQRLLFHLRGSARPEFT